MNKSLAAQKGFSLIELILVVIIVGLIVVLITNLPPTFSLVGNSRNISLAKDIASEEMESERLKDFDSFADGTSQITDSRIGNLPVGSGTITVEPCPDTICSTTEQPNVKKITATVNWKEGEKDQKVELVTLVTRGGLR